MIEKLKKNKIAVFLIIILTVLLMGVLIMSMNTNKSGAPETQTSPIPTQVTEEISPGTDPLNATYNIQNQNISLTNGVNEEQIPNSSTVISTKNFNEPVYGDLNNRPNNPEDASFIIVQEPGGSGTFYYVVASIAGDAGYYGTNGILLGDRIAIQNQEIMADGTIVVNYADRPEGASMADQPTEAVSKYFRLEGTELVEVDAPSTQTTQP